MRARSTDGCSSCDPLFGCGQESGWSSCEHQERGGRGVEHNPILSLGAVDVSRELRIELCEKLAPTVLDDRLLEVRLPGGDAVSPE